MLYRSIRKLSILLALAATVTLPLCGQEAPVAAAGPTPYPDKNNDSAWPGRGVIRVFDWMKVNREYFWTQRSKKQGAIVITGDSLVGNWKNFEKEGINGMLMANRGIGGDVSRGLLFRFKEDVLDLNPKAVIILVGTNDLSSHDNPSNTISNISEMVDMALGQNSKMPIVLCTIPPRNSKQAPMQPGKLAELNEKIKNLADGKGEPVKLLDLNALLSNADGSFDPQYFKPDQLHLDAPGYTKFQEALQKMFSEIKFQ